MRALWIGLFWVLAACAPPHVGPDTGKARFPDYPDALFEAFRAACDGPAANFLQPARDTVECRQFLPPDVTAGLILAHDGTVEDLPQLVIRFTASADAPGYVVENDVYVNVPQATGGARRVRQEDRTITWRLNRLYTRAGGVPE